jgi:hypothetical protein
LGKTDYPDQGGKASGKTGNFSPDYRRIVITIGVLIYNDRVRIVITIGMLIYNDTVAVLHVTGAANWGQIRLRRRI